jgi:hypothetical protein
MIEIGVAGGETMEYILRNLDTDYRFNYTGIDPYVAYPEYKDDVNGRQDRIGYNDRTVKKVRWALKDVPNKIIRMIKNFSHSVCDRFDNNSIDIVFVDGNHNYIYVKKDIENYWPIVKKKGIIVFHDHIPRGQIFDGVRRAVDEFCKKNNSPLHVLGDLVYVIKG